MKKPKPPIIPYCLCRGWLHWLFQIASPSKCAYHAFHGDKPAAMKYFAARAKYEVDLARYKEGAVDG